MADRKYYCFCDSNCKFETMSKEQILAAIAEATGKTVGDVDEAFISHIKETNANKDLKFWRGTMSQFNAIATKDANTYYIITDDNTVQGLQQSFAGLHEDFKSIETSLGSGSFVVGKAKVTTGQFNSFIHDFDTTTTKIEGEIFERGKTYICHSTLNGNSPQTFILCVPKQLNFNENGYASVLSTGFHVFMDGSPCGVGYMRVFLNAGRTEQSIEINLQPFDGSYKTYKDGATIYYKEIDSAQ